MKKIFLATFVFFGLVFVSHAQNTHKIGDKFGGGIIFDIDTTGNHGLIAAPADAELAGKDVLNWFNAKAACKYLELGGYNDWFLPDKDKLNLLYDKRDFVGGFSRGYYWSSSEAGNSAWARAFDGGFLINGFVRKTSPMYVRVVRAF